MSVQSLTPSAQFHGACTTVGLSLSDDELHKLGQYLALLLSTNQQFNLTAITAPDAAWMRHVLDSLSVLAYIESAQQIIDVGSGGGLPGLPLAICCPDKTFVLLEATGKKARFLQTAAAELGLNNVTVHHNRAETIGQQALHRQKYDVAMARAVGPMRVLLELALPLVKIGGRVLAMKGRRVVDELDEAGDAMMLLGAGAVEVYEALPGLEDEAVIVEIVKDRTTPRTYPRRPGEPKTNPL